MPIAPTVLGGHRVLRQLGAGGMGTVYLAEDATLARQVAVKVVSASALRDEGARARFLREARAMATVEHPNVVHVYSFGESEGRPYLVMEYVEGETLSARIHRTGPLAFPDAIGIIRQAAAALEAACDKGIVHRDVKPPNILIDGKGRVRVADFGLAKESRLPAGASVTQDGTFLGTPHYVSPEQARGEDVDFRSDIYSLGIVLYEMLAGVPPFVGTTPYSVIAQHLQTPTRPLRETRPETPPRLARLVERMTEKDRDRRPSSYAALRAAIEDAADGGSRWTSGSPYRGLAPFDFEHAAVFCGRTRAVADVVAAVRAQEAAGRAFVLVLGMSGSGKSSLLRAGVVPLLLAPRGGGSGLWRRATFRPGDSALDLFGGLGAALLRPESLPELGADGTTAAEIGRLLRESPSVAAPLVKGGLSQAAAGAQQAQALKEQPEARLVLVVDQMEELFTLDGIGAHERRQFVDILSGLARSSRVWVLATLRSDYYARCEELPELMALKEGAGQYHLLPPVPAEIGQMIGQPARAAGLRFEEDAVTKVTLDERLRDAAAGQVGNLPLLQFALEELYHQRTGEGVLTWSAYDSIGGVEGALARRAESVFASCPDAVQRALYGVLPALVRVGAGAEERFNRKYAPLESFRSPETRALVDAFVSARLFVADRGDDGNAVVSMGHEALLQSWPRLREWLQQNRELLRVRGRVAMAAALWEENGRPRDLLLPEGKALEEALPLLGDSGIDLTDTERALVQASDVRARGRRRAQQVMNVNSVILMVATGAIIAIYLWKVVPTLAAVKEMVNQRLSLPVRIQIVAANWILRLSPLIVAGGAGAYVFRKRIPAPEFVRSGAALAVVIGLALLFSLFAFMMALFDTLPLLEYLLPQNR